MKFLTALLFAATLTFAFTACDPDERGEDINYADENPGGTIGTFGDGTDGVGGLGGPGNFGNQGDVLGAGGSSDKWDTPSRRLNLGFPVIYFAYDSDALGESEVSKLQQVASYLQNNAGVGVIIEGNCDERGTEEYNRALGERRALSVKGYFGKMGIGEDRFRTISYGEDRPAVQGTGEAVWRLNRRAELQGVDIR